MPLGILDLRALRKYYKRAAIDVVAAIVDLPAASSISLVKIQQPAAGNEASIFFDRGSIIRPVWFQAQLVTSAVANNRNCKLSINLQDYNQTINIQANPVQVAGTQRQWCFIRGYPLPGQDSGFNAGNINLFLPDLVLKGPVTLSTSSFQLDGGDQYSNVFLLFEVVS